MLALIHCHEVTLQVLEQDAAKLLVSAGSQQCSSDCLFETICRMSATSCDSSPGAPKGCQTLLISWSGGR